MHGDRAAQRVVQDPDPVETRGGLDRLMQCILDFPVVPGREVGLECDSTPAAMCCLVAAADIASASPTGLPSTSVNCAEPGSDMAASECGKFCASAPVASSRCSDSRLRSPGTFMCKFLLRRRPPIRRHRADGTSMARAPASR